MEHVAAPLLILSREVRRVKTALDSETPVPKHGPAVPMTEYPSRLDSGFEHPLYAYLANMVNSELTICAVIFVLPHDASCTTTNDDHLVPSLPYLRVCRPGTKPLHFQ